MIDLSAGELDVAGITGNKDVRMHAGELRIDVGTPQDYALIEASVWAGELTADPLRLVKAGLFRSLAWQGDGEFELRVHLKAGAIDLYSRSDTES